MKGRGERPVPSPVVVIVVVIIAVIVAVMAVWTEKALNFSGLFCYKNIDERFVILLAFFPVLWNQGGLFSENSELAS